MKRLKARGLHEHVIEEVGRRIVGGEFLPGQALPNEVELCDTLGVSRTALREALRVLASKGLVEPKRKVGTLVRPTEDWNFLDTDVLSWRLEGLETDRVIDELYELRHLIEPLAASLAARHARATDMKALQQSYEDMLAAGDDGERISAPDLVFHRTIITASGNRLFSSLAQVMGAALAVNFKLLCHAPNGHPKAMPAHKKILDAIKDHNASAARLAMQKLIEYSWEEAKTLRKSAQRREVHGARMTGR